MTKTFKEAIAGIRTAIYGREVREDIAQMGEYVEQFAQTAIDKAAAALQSAKDALASANAAKNSETNAASSQKASASSASAAATSASNAKISEGNAGKSATAAASSASAAKTSETNSKTSETNAKTSEINAKTSETNAKKSASAAASSQSAAAGSASAAKTSESNAASSASAAKTSESNAAASAKAASASQTAAATSETNAAASEKNASDSASKAASSQSAAADSASAAKTSEDNASKSAANAATSATAAEKSEAEAKSAAETATAQAEAAAGSESRVETNAKAAESAASAALDSQNAAAKSASSAKDSETISKEYLEQVKTITLGAQGWYETPEALAKAVPIGENGWWAVIGSTDTIWVWDSDTNAWKDTFTATELGDYYTREQIDGKLTGKANANHTHLYAGSDSAGGKANSAKTADSVDWANVTGKPTSYPPGAHTHSQYYDSAISRTANTVLAAPNGSAGTATFRKLVAADLPSLSTLINTLPTGTATPADADYYVCQYVGGGTAYTNYHRRTMSALWSYIKGKADSVYAAISHTHKSVIDNNNGSSATTFCYSKAGMGYGDYTWLAAWNGYELRAVAKTQFALASHTHAYLPTAGGTMTGDVIFTSIGDTATSKKITWSGSTDGADIYYQTTAADQGNLVLNLRDDSNCYLRIAYNGTFKSYFSPSDGNFHGNVNGTADTATKLGTSAGSATQPVYFMGGKPAACTYTLGKSVPSNAVFTDTNTWRGIQNNLTSDSTSDSLSAAQGKALKALVDGKAASNHTHSAGTTGAFSGVSASGTNYVRFTDGTQICWDILSFLASGTQTVNFPVQFSSAPRLSVTLLPYKSINIPGHNYVTNCGTGSLTFYANEELSINYIAIGKWK